MGGWIDSNKWDESRHADFVHLEPTVLNYSLSLLWGLQLCFAQCARLDLIGQGGSGNSDDTFYDEAVALVAREGKASTSFIQRHLQIGYNRAARIMEQMEEQGVVSKADRVGRRKVLVGSH